jgi:hypothetical protein
MAGTLVVVPCGRAKIWDREPGTGPTPARDAYVGVPFRVSRDYAERFGDRWVILSAKYGFLFPDMVVAGPYDTSFARRSSRPVGVAHLRAQVRDLALTAFKDVVVLGGRHYREAVATAFAGTAVTLHFPFAGLPLGKSIQATQRAIAHGTALPARG